MLYSKVLRMLPSSLALVLVACGADPRTIVDGDPAPFLANSESRVITSVATGRDYQITVTLPRGYAETDGVYPVLYAVDANGQFGTVVEAVRLLRIQELVPEMIVVGVGYPVGHMWNAYSPRSVDLTPTSDPEWERREAMDYPELPPPEGSGGAPGFLQFFVEELIPLVESEYRANPTDHGLYGHSFGGLFAVYALLNSQGAFQRYIIGSPSLWWDDRMSFELESAHYERRDSLPARVFLSVGLLEEVEGEVLAQYAQVSNLEEFISVLESRNYTGLELETVFFPEETHNSVIPATVSRGLRSIYRGWND